MAIGGAICCLLAVAVVASAAMALLGQRALIGIVATHLARQFDYGTLGLALGAGDFGGPAFIETREGMLDQIEREISIEGALDAEQRKKLMEIADKCPVHRTLHSEIRIVTRAV